MRRPPEFIEVTEANVEELRSRARREPHIRNGLMRAPGDSGVRLNDTLVFPWPDAITELGQLAEDAECELRGEPLPAWPISRLRLEPGDIVIVRCGGIADSALGGAQKYLERCKKVFRDALTGAGYGEEVQAIFLADNIEISVIAANADREDTA